MQNAAGRKKTHEDLEFYSLGICFLLRLFSAGTSEKMRGAAEQFVQISKENKHFRGSCKFRALGVAHASPHHRERGVHRGSRKILTKTISSCSC